MDTYTQRGMPAGSEEVSASRMMDDEMAQPSRGPSPTVTITQQDGRFMVSVDGAEPARYAFASLDEAAPVVMQAFGVAPAAEDRRPTTSPMMPAGRGRV